MGQKTSPKALRLGITEKWESNWFTHKDYAKWLHEDLAIRRLIKDRLYRAGISQIEIQRVGNRCTVKIHSARPGIVIGRRGAETEKLQADLEKKTGRSIRIEVEEIKRPELDAQLVAELVAMQIERRANFRQAIKKNIETSMKAGAEGVKIAVGGRLGGADMARSDSSIEGRVPLHTLRANIDYGFAEANTTYGKIGVKTWIFKGEVIGKVNPYELTTGRVSQVPSAKETSGRPSRRRRSRRRGRRSKSTD